MLVTQLKINDSGVNPGSPELKKNRGSETRTDGCFVISRGSLTGFDPNSMLNALFSTQFLISQTPFNPDSGVVDSGPDLSFFGV